MNMAVANVYAPMPTSVTGGMGRMTPKAFDY